MGFGPNFTAIRRSTTGVPQSPSALTVTLDAPAVSDTFVSIISTDPARLTVVGNGVTLTAGQSSAAVTVNALLAGVGAQPVTLWATLGNTMGAGVRVEGSLNESDLPAEADFCNVAGPYAFTVDTGQPTPPIYGQLGESGVTQIPGPPAGWIAQVGYGPPNSNPINLSGWRFQDATYEAQHFYADSFEASFVAPSPGEYWYFYRFSNDGGALWTYCDTSGSGSDFERFFETIYMGVMTVQ